jgi:hypothetical protein
MIDKIKDFIEDIKEVLGWILDGCPKPEPSPVPVEVKDEKSRKNR